MKYLRAAVDAVDRMPVVLWRAIVKTCLVVGIFFAIAEVGGITLFPSPIYYLTHPIKADAALYYRDARVAIEYGWRQLDNPDEWYAVTRRLGAIRPDPPGPSLYPPLQTAIVLPFALLPYRVEYWVWLAAMTACLAFIILRAVPQTLLRRRDAVLLCAVFTPVPFGLAHGQVTYIVGAAVVGAWILLGKGRTFLAGIVLTLILLKPEIALLVPAALLVAGRWRAFIGCCAGVAGVGIGYLVTLPFSTLVAYVQRLQLAAQYPSRWYGMPDVSFLSIHGWPGILLAGFVAVLVFSIAYRARRLAERDTIAIAAALIGSILISHYVHYQDFLMLLLAGWWLLALAPTRSIRLLLAVSYLAIEAENLATDGQTMVVCMAGLVALLTIASERAQALSLEGQPIEVAA